MKQSEISVLCLQETHEAGSQYFWYDSFLVILSGTECDGRTFTGVGFIVAPTVTHAVVGFLQYSDRLASLRMRVPGGQVCIASAYAPTNCQNFETRQAFYAQAYKFNIPTG